MVSEHADAAAGAGAELGEALGQVVQALDVLDDHTLDAQVVTPDLLDDRGVVDALDPDARGRGDLGLNVAHPPRAGVGVRGRGGRGGDVAHEGNAEALVQEAARAQPEDAGGAVAVLEADQLALDGALGADDGADEVLPEDLDDGAPLRGQFRVGRGAVARVAGEDVPGVGVVEAHGPTAYPPHPSA